MDAAAARLADLEAADKAAGRQTPDGSEHVGVSNGASAGDNPADDGTDDDLPGGESAAGGKAAGLLCAEARIAELEATAAAVAGAEDSSSSSLRAEFHKRLFALLLRYKSLQGAGFQVSDAMAMSHIN